MEKPIQRWVTDEMIEIAERESKKSNAEKVTYRFSKTPEGSEIVFYRFVRVNKRLLPQIWKKIVVR